MPDKLTDNEIIKMLECCKQEIDSNAVICGGCKKCPNYDGKTGLCKEDLPTVVLDLINRLQAENERLKTNLNVELENFATEYDDKIKAEAYKECIQKIKVKSKKEHLVCSGASLRTNYTITDKELNNLLKDLVGDNNAGN